MLYVTPTDLSLTLSINLICSSLSTLNRAFPLTFQLPHTYTLRGWR